jgi:hypothetical protein
MKKTIKIHISIKDPDEVDKLAENIQTKAKEMGSDCPIDKEILAILAEKKKVQKEKRAEARKLHAQAEAATLDADTALGIAKGQNVNTLNTMYNAVTIIRDMLLIKYRGREEMLCEFGFKVVIGSTKSPSKKP